jgi:ATP-dependent phosphofructokinase / diphosphate-dependent phosphofructokinase
VRIGILTSGGDCAGLNAVIRAVVRRAVGAYGFEVVGVQEATHGLLARPVRHRLLDQEAVSGILHTGGTILGTTNRGNPFAYPMPDGRRVDRSDEVVEGYHMLRLDGLIGIGGDGSLAILRALAQKGGWRLVGIPKTIDNDLDFTERAIGFSTAVVTATEALDRLHVTAASHNRVMILEVMGRDAGHIALTAGIAGGADVILIPEIAYRLHHVCAKIEERRRRGKNFSLIIVAEAVRTEDDQRVTYTAASGEVRYGGIGQYLAERIGKMTGAETRVTVLGHVQRGGSPVPLDRVLGSAYGVHAVDLLADGRHDRMVGWRQREVTDFPLAEAIAEPRLVDPEETLVQTARGLGISFGDDDR